MITAMCVNQLKIVFFLIYGFLFAYESVSAQRNVLSGENGGPSNYKDALLVYPTGIRSERDLPVCPSLVEEESSKDIGPSFSPGVSNNYGIGNDASSRLQQPSSTRNPSDSSKKSDKPAKSLSACNVIHKRYFLPPMIERLCRCPDRTECPMEWSSPPQYKHVLSSNKQYDEARQAVRTTPSTTKFENTMDPFTVMISSRTQLKFCTEVNNVGTCDRQSKQSSDDFPSMTKTIKKTFLAPELPSVSVNCYCPPLFHGWKFLYKNDLTKHSNGTAEATYFYRCDKLMSCGMGEQCGSVRTDLHFSYYHCSCPKNHLCTPNNYPPKSSDDLLDEAEEALYTGQISPAYCLPDS